MVGKICKIRYGLIAQIDYKKGTCKVYFPELDIMSDWASLPKRVNENWIFPINAQVCVVYDQDENYEVLCQVPSTEEKPPSWSDEHTEGIEFSDGSKVTYNSSSKEMTIDAPNAELSIKCKKLTVSGDMSISGDISGKGAKFTSDVISGTISLQKHIHGVSGSNTTQPTI